MRVFRVLAVLTFGAAVAAQAQLAVTQPTEKLLLLPFSVTAAERPVFAMLYRVGLRKA